VFAKLQFPVFWIWLLSLQSPQTRALHRLASSSSSRACPELERSFFHDVLPVFSTGYVKCQMSYVNLYSALSSKPLMR